MTPTKYTTQEQIEAMRKEILQEKQKLLNVSERKKSFRGWRPQGKQIVRSISGAIFLGVSLFLVWSIISIQITKSRGEIPNVLGFQLFAIESGSMEPTLEIGAVIVSRKPNDDGSALRVNDIVTFKTLSEAVVTHRVVEVIDNENGSKAYRTKGDNPKNSVDQELLSPNRVIGVFVAKIPLT